MKYLDAIAADTIAKLEAENVALRADLQEARGLLERAMEWMGEPEHINHAAEDARWRRQRELLEKVRVFLARIGGGEEGETR